MRPPLLAALPFEFLSWQTALLAGALSVPTLLLLYFLKLRRQERTISSTLLWKKAIQDLQVNAPFQKLRKNLLLFLQLLILAAILFALGNPVANLIKTSERNIVILIDRSGSMKTMEADGRIRLDHAKDGAIDFASHLPEDTRAMVISFADRAEVVCSFTSDGRRLARRIEQIEPTDAPSLIGEALQLASAYSTKIAIGGEGWAPGSIQTAELELFSDGRLSDADEKYVTRGKMNYYRVGKAADNAGIVAFDLRRDLEQPGVISVFVRIENFGPQPITSDVSLSLNGRMRSVREVNLAPSRQSTTQPGSPSASHQSADADSSQVLLFKLEQESGGIVEVKLHREDTLAADNIVRAPIDPPRSIRILVVSSRPLVRRDMTKAFGVHDLTMMAGTEYEKVDEDALAAEGRSAYDLVVLDNHDTDRLWPGNYLFFGGVPKIQGVALEGDVNEHLFVSWRDTHPLLRHVTLDNVYVWKWKRLKLPTHAEKLVEGEDSTVMAFLSDVGHRYVITAFDLLDSNWRSKFAYPIFLQNVVSYLAAGGLMRSGHMITPGETITLPVPPGATMVRITRPDGSTETIKTESMMSVTYAHTRRCGLYKAAYDDPAESTETYAANMSDPNESHVIPNSRFTIGTEQVQAASGEIKANEPLWPYAAAVALVILLLEWWIYNKRVMI